MHKNNNGLTKGKANNIDQLVSKQLKMRRLLLGFTQQDLGVAIDVSIQQIQKYENGTNRISSGRLYSIAEFLKVPVTYFFEPKNYYNPGFNYIVAEDQEEYIAPKSYKNKDSQNINNNLLPHMELCDKEVIGLVKAFGEIKNKDLRKKIIELVKSINTPYESDKL